MWSSAKNRFYWWLPINVIVVNHDLKFYSILSILSIENSLFINMTFTSSCEVKKKVKDNTHEIMKFTIFTSFDKIKVIYWSLKFTSCRDCTIWLNLFLLDKTDRHTFNRNLVSPTFYWILGLQYVKDCTGSQIRIRFVFWKRLALERLCYNYV